MSTALNRRKAAMVLHDIEASLGDFILDTEIHTENFPEEVIQGIIKREQEKDRFVDASKPRDVIEATYLDELFQILLEITKDTSTNKFIERLRQQFIIHGIYEIRNIISHPNRQFIDHHWYKVASLASDPVIDILGMTQVKRSLAAAENGEIIDPPEDWFQKKIWEIPNNLPANFEHAITGLVGRQKEASDLLGLIKNQRINNIAIVAPGGIGKTSLVLDLLASHVKIPEAKNYFDSCIFATLKTEKLTASGVVKLDAVETIQELKSLIKVEAERIFSETFDDFEDLCAKKGKDKVLLFIDNLETLLIDSQQDFHDFNNNLPPAWRLLVTSRIAINNASIVTLEPLKPKSATHLARVYLGRKGGDAVDEEVLADIARQCHFNPLAIRLTIDLYISGKEIPSSINVANKEIASFSFSNLIDNLKEESVKILEALFVTQNCSRATLCEILNLSREDVAQGVSELSNTSLIARETSDAGESYTLSDSIRELLLVNTRNIIIREKIQEEITKRITLSKQIEANQIKQSIPEYHWEYIPKEINPNLKLLLAELNKSTTKLQIRNDKAASLHRAFKESEYLYEEFSVFNRGYGRVLEALKANELAILKYKKAIEQNVDDPSSKLLLAMLYHKCGQYESAHALYEELMDAGWGVDKDGDASIAYLTINGFYLSLLYDHKYDEILEHTKKWKDSEAFRGLIGTYRATAWKRKSENLTNSDPIAAAKYLTSSMRILDDVFQRDGYIKPACIQAKNIFNEIAYFLKGRNSQATSEFAAESLGFINRHLTNTVEHVSYSGDDFIVSLIEKLSKIEAPDNPFKKKFWLDICEGGDYEGVDINEIEQKGLAIISVTRIPKGKNNGPNTFIFGADSSGGEFFLHFDQLRNGSWRNWAALKPGEKLAVKPDQKPLQSNRASTVLDIYLVDLD
ncbi:hypothetical protein [Pseudomonas aeruginosa]|uniref:hypothetical protein n=1 Tax=Pseudomonas aeruginosa TaxID=287 RepID=UPI003CF845D6